MKEGNNVTNAWLYNKLQPGTKVRCVDDGGWDFLTKGKIYEVLDYDDYDDPGFSIKDDDGDICFVDEGDPEKFELADEKIDVKNEETNIKQDGFQVGDKVWDIIFGKGTVSEVNGFVEVSFPWTAELFTEDGVHLGTKEIMPDGYNVRTLFFSEPKIEAALTRPFVPTLIGKTVTVIADSLEGMLPPFRVVHEDDQRIFDSDGDYYTKEGLIAVHEVLSENLLKK